MNRRDSLIAMAGATLAAISASTGAHAQTGPHDHHAAHGSAGTANASLIQATSQCISAGETCLAHCLVLLGEGERDMAECARSVSEMLALCGALRALAGQQSNHTRALAKVVLEACIECEKACQPHAEKHAECKACMDACAECAKVCKQATV